MTEEQQKKLSQDRTGLITYEYMANNIGTIEDDIDFLVDNMIKVDLSGQFTASAARYLAAIDAAKYAEAVRRLVGATIDRDREHRYLPGLLDSIYGPKAIEKAEELSATDNNFRRIYKRLYPKGI